MPNLSHLVIIDDVLEMNHTLQALVSEYGEDIPEIILHCLSNLDHSCRQFGDYWNVYYRMVEKGEIPNA